MTATAPSAPGTERIDAIQLLRAVAAALVVVGHSQSAASGLAAGRHESFARLTVLPWGAGVDLFFAISGFIMVYASQRLFGRRGAWREFLRRRLMRIAPVYWLWTTLYLAILLAAHLKGDPRGVKPAAALASYLFLPFETDGRGTGAFPVFDLGWTLNYEMFFYALFALAVGFARLRAVGTVLLGLTLLVVAGWLLEPSTTALRFWTQPIILDFGLGVAVAALRCEGVRWPVAVRWAVLAIGVAVFVMDPLHLFSGAAPGVTVSNGLPRVLVSGLPAAAVLAAATLGSDVRLRALTPVVLVGNASYSLYLTHPFVLILMEKLATRTPLAAWIGYGALVALTVTLALVVGLAAFRWVEEPLARAGLRLTRRWAPARSIPAAAPAVGAVP